MGLRLVTVGVLVFASACAWAEGAAADVPTVPLANFDREVLATSDSHVFWYSREIVEATRRHRGQSFTLRYYLQPVGQAEASLIHQEVVVDRVPRGVILADGSVAIRVDSRVTWVAPKTGGVRREDLAIDGERASCLAWYPDGAVLQPARSGVPAATRAPAYWVPIEAGGGFEMDGKWELTGGRGVDPHTAFARSGDALVWIGASSPPGVNEPGKHRAHLAVADLGRRTVRTRDLPPERIGAGHRPLAFDGKTIYTGPYFIDIAMSRVVDAAYMTPLGMRDGRMFGYRKVAEEISPAFVDVREPDRIQDWKGLAIADGPSHVGTDSEAEAAECPHCEGEGRHPVEREGVG